MTRSVILRAMAIMLIGLGVIPTANFLTMAEQQHWWHAAVGQWVVWGIMVVGVALLTTRLAPAAVEAAADSFAARLRRPSDRSFALLIASLTCALGVFFGWLLFGFQAATIDELSEQWQAHIFAAGRIVARAEPHDEFFSTMQTVSLDGRWFSHFPAGGPLLQSAGVLLRAPWLVNPLLVAIAAVAVYRVAAAFGNETRARLAALLFATSPFVLFVAASRLDHAGTLAAVWVAIAALAQWNVTTTDRAMRRAAAVIGLGLGIATMIRPYDGAIATLTVGVFQMLVAGRDASRWRSLVVQASVGAIPIACLLIMNRAMTGHPLTFAYDVLNGAEHRPGFHMSPLGFAHTPRHGIYLISSYLMRLNVALLGWPVPVVLLTAIVLLLQRSAARLDLLLVGLLAATLFAYFLYWGEGSFNGPRFLYMVGPVFIIFVVRLPGALRARTHSAVLRTATLLLMPLWAGAAWALPMRAIQPFSVWAQAAHAQQVEAVSPMLVDATRRMHLTNALVFVEDGWHARLTARLRALGAPPFFAQLMVGRYDACAIQDRLDAAERTGAPRDRQAAEVFSFLDRAAPTRPVAGLSALEQLALVPGQPLEPSCQRELDRALAHGADMARLLPVMTLDANGRLSGDVVYARDFGARNELLRERFPDRVWYTARAVVAGDSLVVVVEPYR
jgi:4-amino-4-deoxy-L-arabinose transferase-like glycosyltransferase